MKRYLFLLSVFFLISIKSSGFQPISLHVEVIAFQTDSLELSIGSGWFAGPPAPDFLGLWVSKISNDTIYVHPLYEWIGPASSFASGRFDTVKLKIPPGVHKVNIHSGMRQFPATSPPNPNKDTVLSNHDTTLVLNALSVFNVIKFNSFSLHPNPVRSVLNIESKFITYEMYNVWGTKVMAGKYSARIDVAALKEGMYFLRLKAKHAQLSTRFIKIE